MVKNGYYGNDGFIFCLRFRRHFLGIPNWVIDELFKKKFGLKGVIEKCVDCFLVYLFLRALFFYKKVLRDRKFKFLCETYPLVRCNTHY